MYWMVSLGSIVVYAHFLCRSLTIFLALAGSLIEITGSKSVTVVEIAPPYVALAELTL